MINCIDSDNIKFMAFKFTSPYDEECHHKIEFLILEEFKDEPCVYAMDRTFPIRLNSNTYVVDRAIGLFQRNGTCLSFRLSTVEYSD